MGLSENLAAAAIDATYSVHGRDASYAGPGGGASVPCRVLFDIRDQDAKPGDVAPPVGQIWIEVRTKEVAQPEAKGTFTLGVKTYKVMTKPVAADADGYGWKMWAK
jgi:hypothetical protein